MGYWWTYSSHSYKALTYVKQQHLAQDRYIPQRSLNPLLLHFKLAPKIFLFLNSGKQGGMKVCITTDVQNQLDKKKMH